MKSHILARIDLDWADEFSCYAFAVMSKETWEDLKLSTKNCVDRLGPQEVYFGTNEHWEDVDYDRWLRAIEVDEIEGYEFDTLKALFSKTYQLYDDMVIFGTGSNFIHFARETFEDEEDLE